MRRARLNESWLAVRPRSARPLTPVLFLPVVELEEVTTGRRTLAYIGLEPSRDRLYALMRAGRTRRLLAQWVLDAPTITVDRFDVFAIAS